MEFNRVAISRIMSGNIPIWKFLQILLSRLIPEKVILYFFEMYQICNFLIFVRRNTQNFSKARLKMVTLNSKDTTKYVFPKVFHS